MTNDLLQELRPAVQATVASETQANGKGKSTGAPRTRKGGALLLHAKGRIHCHVVCITWCQDEVCLNMLFVLHL